MKMQVSGPLNDGDRWPRTRKPIRPTERLSSVGAGVLVLLVALWFSSGPAPSAAAPASIDPGASAGKPDASSTGDGKGVTLAEAVRLSAQADEDSSRGAYAAAEPRYRDALAVSEAVLGPNALQVAGPLHNLGRVYPAWGRLDEARSLYRREERLFEREVGPNSFPLGLVLADLADIAGAQGHAEEAERLYRRALAMVEGALGAGSPRTATLLGHYAALLVKLNRTAEAEQLTREARAEGGLSPAGAIRPPTIFSALGALAAFYVLLPVGLVTFFRYRPRQEVLCPVNSRPARLQIDPRRAALGAIGGRAALRVTSCSLWPQGLGCRQACLTLPSGADTRI
jgi:tetratricopeptide repeat protein